MPENKGGRPRGPNYEKNLAKRNRAIQNITKQKQPAGNSPPNNRLLTLTKSLFHRVNSDRYAAKKPVFNHSELQLHNDGIELRHPGRLSHQDLRDASMGTSIFGAICNLRVNNLAEFADPEYFTFAMRDKKAKPKTSDDKLIRQATDFFSYMGEKNKGWANRDHLKAVLEMMVRDTLTIDAVAFYLSRNRFGKLKELHYLDPATILPVDRRRGYRGDRGVGWVQVIDGTVQETFGHDEIVMRHKNHLSDIRYRGTGFAPAEVCIKELAGIINGMKFNSQRFSNNPPPGFMQVLGHVDQEVLDDLNLQWSSLWEGNENNFEIPILSSEREVKWTPLAIKDDMFFDRLMQWYLVLVAMWIRGSWG